ncbi:hypothetical protein ADUPG1_006951, partial [Aduncisulcus paluster]
MPIEQSHIPSYSNIILDTAGRSIINSGEAFLFDVENILKSYQNETLSDDELESAILTVYCPGETNSSVEPISCNLIGDSDSCSDKSFSCERYLLATVDSYNVYLTDIYVSLELVPAEEQLALWSKVFHYDRFTVDNEETYAGSLVFQSDDETYELFTSENEDVFSKWQLSTDSDDSFLSITKHFNFHVNWYDETRFMSIDSESFFFRHNMSYIVPSGNSCESVTEVSTSDIETIPFKVQFGQNSSGETPEMCAEDIINGKIGIFALRYSNGSYSYDESSSTDEEVAIQCRIINVTEDVKNTVTIFEGTDDEQVVNKHTGMFLGELAIPLRVVSDETSFRYAFYISHLDLTGKTRRELETSEAALYGSFGSNLSPDVTCEREDESTTDTTAQLIFYVNSFIADSDSWCKASVSDNVVFPAFTPYPIPLSIITCKKSSEESTFSLNKAFYPDLIYSLSVTYTDDKDTLDVVLFSDYTGAVPDVTHPFPLSNPTPTVSSTASLTIEFPNSGSWGNNPKILDGALSTAPTTISKSWLVQRQRLDLNNSFIISLPQNPTNYSYPSIGLEIGHLSIVGVFSYFLPGSTATSTSDPLLASRVCLDNISVGVEENSIIETISEYQEDLFEFAEDTVDSTEYLYSIDSSLAPLYTITLTHTISNRDNIILPTFDGYYSGEDEVFSSLCLVDSTQTDPIPFFDLLPYSIDSSMCSFSLTQDDPVDETTVTYPTNSTEGFSDWSIFRYNSGEEEDLIQIFIENKDKYDNWISEGDLSNISNERVSISISVTCPQSDSALEFTLDSCVYGKTSGTVCTWACSEYGIGDVTVFYVDSNSMNYGEISFQQTQRFIIGIPFVFSFENNIQSLSLLNSQVFVENDSNVVANMSNSFSLLVSDEYEKIVPRFLVSLKFLKNLLITLNIYEDSTWNSLDSSSCLVTLDSSDTDSDGDVYFDRTEDGALDLENEDLDVINFEPVEFIFQLQKSGTFMLSVSPNDTFVGEYQKLGYSTTAISQQVCESEEFTYIASEYNRNVSTLKPVSEHTVSEHPLSPGDEDSTLVWCTKDEYSNAVILDVTSQLEMVLTYHCDSQDSEHTLTLAPLLVDEVTTCITRSLGEGICAGYIGPMGAVSLSAGTYNVEMNAEDAVLLPYGIHIENTVSASSVDVKECGQLSTLTVSFVDVENDPVDVSDILDEYKVILIREYSTVELQSELDPSEYDDGEHTMLTLSAGTATNTATVSFTNTISGDVSIGIFHDGIPPSTWMIEIVYDAEPSDAYPPDSFFEVYLGSEIASSVEAGQYLSVYVHALDYYGNLASLPSFVTVTFTAGNEAPSSAEDETFSRDDFSLGSDGLYELTIKVVRVNQQLSMTFGDDEVVYIDGEWTYDLTPLSLSAVTSELKFVNAALTRDDDGFYDPSVTDIVGVEIVVRDVYNNLVSYPSYAPIVTVSLKLKSCDSEYALDLYGSSSFDCSDVQIFKEIEVSGVTDTP